MDTEKGKKWVGLDEAMGDCQCCIHQDECAPLKQQEQHYRFRCPILIEDENIEFAKSNKNLDEAKKAIDDYWKIRNEIEEEEYLKGN